MIRKLGIIVLTLALTATAAWSGSHCPGSMAGFHGPYQWDGYGRAKDFAGRSNHLFYYDWRTPNLSLVDSTRGGCQTFDNVISLWEAPWDTAYIYPGIQWANNFNCPTITGCAGFDGDHYIDTSDRMALVVMTASAGPGYDSKILADTVRYYREFQRYDFDASFGESQRHELANLPAPNVIGKPKCQGTVCEVSLQIPIPEFDPSGATGGIYGDDILVVQDLLAGFKIVAMQSATVPASALIGGGQWQIAFDGPDANPYVGLSRPGNGRSLRTGSMTIPVDPAGGDLYLAYAPIFNWQKGCAGNPCTAGELKALDGQVGSNSLVSRIASAASIPIKVSRQPKG